MSRLATTLKYLAEGKFICPVAYPEEFDILCQEEHRVAAEAWLEQVGLRLARLSDEGAFFMAHALADHEMRLSVRDELRNVRSRLHPVVPVLEAIRQAQGQDPRLQPGDTIWESEIAERVRQNAGLEQQVMELRELPGMRTGESANDRVRRMLDYLQKEAYLVLTHPNRHGYQVTGKIEYLYGLLSEIAANSDLLSDEAVVDQMQQFRLHEQPDGAVRAAQAPQDAESQEGGGHQA